MPTRETRKPRFFRRTDTRLVADERTRSRPQDAAHASTNVTDTSAVAAIACAQGGLDRLHELLLATLLAALSFLLRHSRG